MFIRKTFVATVVSFAAAGAIFMACSKDDDDDDDTPTLTADQKADAGRAGGVVGGRVVGGVKSDTASLRDPHQIAKLREMYLAGKAQKAQVMNKLQDDDAGDFDPATIYKNMCQYMDAGCAEKLDKEEPADEFGDVCKTTSCTGGTTMSCASPSQTSTCDGVTYTLSSTTTTSNLKCTQVSDTKISFDITADFAGTISGGSLEAQELKCHIAIAMPIDFAAEQPATSEDDAEEFTCESGEFTCTLGGAPLSCAEIMAAAEASDCN